jgi:hypothetical protein
VKKIKSYVDNNKILSFDKTIKLNVKFDKDSNMYLIDAGHGTKVIEVSKQIHDRTKILFTTNQTFSQNLNHEEVFYYLLYCMILRYITISEDGVRQGGLTQQFFDALHNNFGVNFETFASSFGASTNYICSLFYDIEKYFGSYGNFFDLDPQKGFYQCSPPLDFLITTMAMEKILAILNKNNNEHSLGFICFIPCWDYETMKKENKNAKIDMYGDFPIYYELVKSKHLIYNHDVVNKNISYYQYQGKGEMLGVFHSPHVIILGNNKFKQEFDVAKIKTTLNKFIKKQ